MTKLPSATCWLTRSLALLACALVSGGQLPSFASTDETVADLIAGVVNEYGGADFIRERDQQPYAIRTRVHVHRYSSMTGADNESDDEIVTKAGKLRTTTGSILGESTGFNGKMAWIKRGDSIRYVGGGNQTKPQIQIDPHSLAQLLVACTKPSTEIALVDQVPRLVDGKPCRVLTVRPTDTAPSIIYVDPQTHQIVRCDYLIADTQGGSALQSTDFQDYRLILGMLRPFKIVSYYQGKKTAEQTTTSIVRDDSISDQYFDPPTQQKIAALEHGPATIPIKFARNLACITARINDTKDCNLMVDTGIITTTLRDTLGRQLGPVGNGMTLDAGSAAVKEGSIQVKKFQIGDVVLDNVSLSVADMTAMTKAGNMTDLDGCLGSDILSRFIVTFDYPNSKLILTDPSTDRIPPHATVLEMTVFAGCPSIKGKLNGTADQQFLIDTGDMENNIHESLLKSVAPGEFLPVGMMMGVDGHILKVGSVKLDNLTLGNLKVEDPVFAVSTGPSAGLFTNKYVGILGSPFWRHFVLTIDYPHGRIMLECPEETIDAAVEKTARIRKQYLQSHDCTTAADQIRGDLNKAQSPVVKVIYQTSLATCLGEQASRSKDPDQMKRAKDQFLLAIDEASKSGDKTAESRARSRYLIYLAKLHENDPGILPMLKLAEQADPRQADYLTFLAAGYMTTDPPHAQALLNTALMAEPDHWEALFLRCQLAQTLHNSQDEELVVAQIQRYYGDIPEIAEVRKGL